MIFRNLLVTLSCQLVFTPTHRRKTSMAGNHRHGARSNHAVRARNDKKRTISDNKRRLTMRMRRTAFIVALMTVFTVSLFAQNSRGRNYIKQNISEWGGCRNVAITDTGGDLALNGKNDYAYTAGIPQALADALEKYHDDDDYIDDVQLTEDGEWLILVGKNGCQWSNIPSKLESKLRQWNEAEETITSVTFNDDGDWIAVSTDHVASSSTDMDDWIKEGIETHGQLWAAHLTNDACVLCFENGYKFLGNVPQKLKDALKATKYDVYRIKFTKEGSYFFADQEGHYTFWM